jgi:hypothetical protein
MVSRMAPHFNLLHLLQFASNVSRHVAKTPDFTFSRDALAHRGCTSQELPKSTAYADNVRKITQEILLLAHTSRVSMKQWPQIDSGLEH